MPPTANPGHSPLATGTERDEMAGNKAVVYQGPGRVEIRSIDYPTYEMQDGPGVNPANVGRKVRMKFDRPLGHRHSDPMLQSRTAG